MSRKVPAVDRRDYLVLSTTVVCLSAPAVHSKVVASTRQRSRCEDKSAVLSGSFKNDAVLCRWSNR
jgi:hypothetical protein